MARRARTLAPLLVAVASAAALAFAGAGCSAGGGVSDSKIVEALDLEHTVRGYEMGRDPFCAVEQLLNDGHEVSAADDRQDATAFVIAGPGGEVGVLAQRPFAPDCSRRAKAALKRLERRSE